MAGASPGEIVAPERWRFWWLWARSVTRGSRRSLQLASRVERPRPVACARKAQSAQAWLPPG